MSRKFIKISLFIGLVYFGFVGCGSSGSQVVEEITQQPQTAPALKVKAQENYSNEDGSFNVQKYKLTQERYVNSNE
jgi:hypothetical protein